MSVISCLPHPPSLIWKFSKLEPGPLHPMLISIQTQCMTTDQESLLSQGSHRSGVCDCSLQYKYLPSPMSQPVRSAWHYSFQREFLYSLVSSVFLYSVVNSVFLYAVVSSVFLYSVVSSVFLYSLVSSVFLYSVVNSVFLYAVVSSVFLYSVVSSVFLYSVVNSVCHIRTSMHACEWYQLFIIAQNNLLLFIEAISKAAEQTRHTRVWMCYVCGRSALSPYHIHLNHYCKQPVILHIPQMSMLGVVCDCPHHTVY